MVQINLLIRQMFLRVNHQQILCNDRQKLCIPYVHANKTAGKHGMEITVPKGLNSNLNL